MKSHSAFILGFFILPISALILGCNSGTSVSSGGSSGLSAKIEGKDFMAEEISLSAQVNAGVAGSVLIIGSQTIDGLTRSLTLTIYNVNGPGTYSLGVDMSVRGGIALVGEGTSSGGGNSWITPNNGRAGWVKLENIGSGEINGTFEYITEPGHGNTATTTRTVTAGQFHLAYKGTYLPAAENKGSKVTGILNQKPYNASTVDGRLTDFTGGAGVTISTLNSESGISLILEGVTAPGTYLLSNTSPVHSIVAGRNGGTAEFCCWQSNAASTGTIIITSLTSDRIKGSYFATLKPSAGKPAKTDMVIESGEFDVGITK